MSGKMLSDRDGGAEHGVTKGSPDPGLLAAPLSPWMAFAQ